VLHVRLAEPNHKKKKHASDARNIRAYSAQHNARKHLSFLLIATFLIGSDAHTCLHTTSSGLCGGGVSSCCRHSLRRPKLHVSRRARHAAEEMQDSLLQHQLANASAEGPHIR
jgi:hypothetical protein